MSDEAQLNSVLEILGADDWEAGYLGDMLICPCGCEVELDGSCPEGHISPLREEGMI